MKRRLRYLTLTIVIVIFALLTACIPGVRLNTTGTEGEDISGTFDLILYGGRYGGDLETVAFLDRTGDAYTFEPFAREDFFVVKKELSAKEALEKAGHFVSGNPDYRYFQLRKILDVAGNGIGYEVHPIYMPLTYGTDDVFEVGYVLREGKVVISVSLYPSVERILYYGGPGDSRR